MRRSCDGPTGQPSCHDFGRSAAVTVSTVAWNAGGGGGAAGVVAAAVLGPVVGVELGSSLVGITVAGADAADFGAGGDTAAVEGRPLPAPHPESSAIPLTTAAPTRLRTGP